MTGLIALLFYLSKIVLNCHTCLLVNSFLFSTFCLSFLCPFILAMLLGCCTCAFCLAFGIFQYKKKQKKNNNLSCMCILMNYITNQPQIAYVLATYICCMRDVIMSLSVNWRIPQMLENSFNWGTLVSRSSSCQK